MEPSLHSKVVRLPRTSVAAIDAGGTKAHMRYKEPETSAIRDLQVRSADYDSLEELFLTCFLLAKCVPTSVVAGVAGRIGHTGDVRITNHPKWPIFRRDHFAQGLDIRLRLLNDLAATAAGVAQLAPNEYELLTPDTAVPSGSTRLAVSVGTGVGTAFMDASGTVHSSESGHVSWQAVTRLEEDYLRSLQKAHPGVAVSVEWSIGGLRGFDRMYDFISERKKPGPYIHQRVDRYRHEHRGIGPIITSAALKGDGCCQEVMRLFGAILGQYLRDMALVYLSNGGSMWLTSGVLQAPGVCGTLIQDTLFLERFLGVGAEHSDLTQQIPVYLVTDREVAVRGAFALTCEVPE